MGERVAGRTGSQTALDNSVSFCDLRKQIGKTLKAPRSGCGHTDGEGRRHWREVEHLPKGAAGRGLTDKAKHTGSAEASHSCPTKAEHSYTDKAKHSCTDNAEHGSP